MKKLAVFLLPLPLGRMLIHLRVDPSTLEMFPFLVLDFVVFVRFTCEEYNQAHLGSPGRCHTIFCFKDPDWDGYVNYK